MRWTGAWSTHRLSMVSADCGYGYNNVTQSKHNTEYMDREDTGIAHTRKYGWIDADDAEDWCPEHPPTFLPHRRATDR